jgi:hypothetical protein
MCLRNWLLKQWQLLAADIIFLEKNEQSCFLIIIYHYQQFVAFHQQGIVFLIN